MTGTVHEVICILIGLCIISQQGVTRDLLVQAPILAEEVEQVLYIQTELQGVLGLTPLNAHVTQILEVQLMVPRHLSATTLSILTLAILQVVILLDEGPEVITLHLCSIWLTINLTLLEVPVVELLTRSRNVDQVTRSRRIVVDVAVEDVRVTAVRICSQITVLISIIQETECIGDVLTLLQLIGCRKEETVRSHVGSITSLVVVNSVDRVTVVVVCRRNLITDTLSI